MKRVYLVDEETRENFLLYENDRGLAHYIRQMNHCVLPSSSKKLLQHFSSFSDFLDTLNEEILLHCVEQPRITGPVITKTIIPPVVVIEKPARQWFEIADDDDDEEEEEEEEEEVEQQQVEEVEEETADIMGDMDEDRPIIKDIDIGPLCGRAWEWHNDVIRRSEEVLTSYYAYSYMLSWVSFCRLFYMNILKNRDKYTLYNDSAPSDHVYNQTIQDIMCIVVTCSPTSEYTMRQTWDTAGRLIPTMYYRQYSSAMKEYTHILLFRYATFLSNYFTDDDDALFNDPSFTTYNDHIVEEEEDEDDDDEEDEDEDDFMTTEAFDEYKNLTVPIHPRYSLKSRFVLEGELLFYSQLMRLNLSSKLHGLPLMTLSYNQHAGNYSEILSRCLIAMCIMVTDVTSNKILRYETGEGYKSNLSHAHLYHGEKERFTRLWPGSSNEPGDVIARFRPNDNLKISETRRLSIPMMCGMYQTEMQETIMHMKDAGDYDNTLIHRLHPFYYVEYEREVVLLTRVCTMEWFNFGALKIVPNLKKAYIIEEMQSLHDIDQILILHKERHNRGGRGRLVTPHKVVAVAPYLVKLMQVYYVIDINAYEISVYPTHFFAEAYLLWLAIACKYKLIPIKLIHETIRPMVNTLQEFLLF